MKLPAEPIPMLTRVLRVQRWTLNRAERLAGRSRTPRQADRAGTRLTVRFGAQPATAMVCRIGRHLIQQADQGGPADRRYLDDAVIYAGQLARDASLNLHHIERLAMRRIRLEQLLPVKGGDHAEP